MNDISELLRALLDKLSNTEEVEREFVDKKTTSCGAKIWDMASRLDIKTS